MKRIGQLMKRFRWTWRLLALVTLENRLWVRYQILQRLPVYDGEADPSRDAYRRQAAAYNRARHAWPFLTPARTLPRRTRDHGRAWNRQMAAAKAEWGGAAGILGL